MYRLMLVEDESEVLDGIMEIVDWERYGYLPPLGCRDGREAIAAIEGGYVPDAVITDIRMPFVGGLELTRFINERLPKTVVVILSGHDEFSYAQQALKLGVYDYVLKPVTPSSLGDLLSALSEALDIRRLNDIEDSMQILMGYFLNKLVSRQLSDDTVEENLRRHQLAITGLRYFAAVMDIDGAEPPDGSAAGHTELMRYALHNIAAELIDLPDKALVFQATDGTTKVVFAVCDEESGYSLAKETLELVCSTFRFHMACTASAGIGEQVGRLGDIHVSHRSALAALAHRFFAGESSVTCFYDLDERGDTDLDLTRDYRGFENALRLFNAERVSSAVSGLFARLRDSKLPVSKCLLCCQRIIVLLHEFTGQFGGADELKLLDSLLEEIDLSSAATINRLEEQIQRLCRKMLELFEPLAADTATQFASRAEAFIREHYDDPGLSLQSITEHLSVSVSYFSANFKAKTGSTFLEYLTRVRMDKAKQILALSDMRTYETAQTVGYADPHYFSVAFKRYTGMSPKEYREYSSKR